MKQRLRDYIASTKKYITDRTDALIGVGVICAIGAIIGIGILISNLMGPRIVYQPTKACDIFTPAKAQNLLGEKVISVDAKDPAITGNVATSKCSYTNSDTNTENLIVAAVAIRSAINDKGIQQNKDDFATARSNNTTDAVTGLGDEAFFNKTNGQLNILDGHKWILINYGVGSAPAANSAEKAVELARTILR